MSEYFWSLFLKKTLKFQEHVIVKVSHILELKEENLFDHFQSKYTKKHFKNSTLLSPIKSVTIIQFLQKCCITSEYRKILPLFHQKIQFAFTIFELFLHKINYKYSSYISKQYSLMKRWHQWKSNSRKIYISRFNRQTTKQYIKNTWNWQKKPAMSKDVFKNGKKTANLDILEA